MNKIESLKTIDPKRVAEKLAAVRNFLLPEVAADLDREPRLVEAMWFLSWASVPENYAGGLARFASDFIAACADKIGPICLIEKGSRQLTVEEIKEILNSSPSLDSKVSRPLLERLSYAALDAVLSEASDDEFQQLEELRSKELSKLDFSALQEPCVQAARDNLAGYFFDVCTDPGTRFFGHKLLLYGSPQDDALWYFPNLWDCFFDWLEARAKSIRRSIASTSVTREVYRWLSLAEETRKGVMIVGNSRFGKTEAIRSFAAMYPGRVRIIETPSSSAEGDLLREIARAIGLSYQPSLTSFHELRTSIDFVLRQSRLMLVFDEGQFLFPSNGGRRSDPPRLNYVRRAIMDIGLPTAFVCTPQSWKRVEKNYLKATGFTIEQFEGRLLRSAVVLPDDLPREEMIDVAKIHFPYLEGDHLEYIVRSVRAFQGSVLSCIENIARLAEIYAREAGRSKPRFVHVERAICDVLPRRIVEEEAIQEPEKGGLIATERRPLQESCRTAARLVAEPDPCDRMAPVLALAD